MKIDNLREFIVFAKHLNFTTAAKELMMTQPGLSTHISQMEKELGAQLVERGSGVSLTPAGRVFLQGCHNLVAEYDRTCASVAQAVHTESPIRVYDFTSASFLPDLLAVMKSVPCEFISLDYSASLIGELDKGTIEVAFVPHAPGDEESKELMAGFGVDEVKFDTEPLSACVSIGDPLVEFVSEGSVPREALRGREAVIFSSMYFDYWRRVLEHVLGDDLGIRYRLDPVRNESSVQFADVSGSIHFCNRAFCHRLAQGNPDIVVFDLIEGRSLQVEWDMAYKRGNMRVEPILRAARCRKADDCQRP